MSLGDSERLLTGTRPGLSSSLFLFSNLFLFSILGLLSSLMLFSPREFK